MHSKLHLQYSSATWETTLQCPCIFKPILHPSKSSKRLLLAKQFFYFLLKKKMFPLLFIFAVENVKIGYWLSSLNSTYFRIETFLFVFSKTDNKFNICLPHPLSIIHLMQFSASKASNLFTLARSFSFFGLNVPLTSVIARRSCLRSPARAWLASVNQAISLISGYIL